jgi:hypothetical protein
VDVRDGLRPQIVALEVARGTSIKVIARSDLSFR